MFFKKLNIAKEQNYDFSLWYAFPMYILKWQKSIK